MTSVYLDEYQKAISWLVEARKTAGVTQQHLADKLGRPQSFVAKFENGERRLDMIEFLHIADFIGIKFSRTTAFLSELRVPRA